MLKVRTRRWWLVSVLVLMLAACNSYKNEDYADMNEIPMRTVCVGRLLVALPEGRQEWQQQFDYAKVSKLPASVGTKQEFHAYVKKRKSELEEQTEQNPNGQLFSYFIVSNDALIILYRKLGIRADSLHTKRYLWTEHWGYQYETGALSDNDAINLASRSKDYFGHVQPIKNSEPPNKSGFCIDSALVTGDIGPISVRASVHATQWQDVMISIGLGEDDGSRELLSWQSQSSDEHLPSAFDDLEAKEASADARRHADEASRVVSFDVLRKRETEIAGISGQETAYRQELANGQEYYDFNWESTNDNTRSNNAYYHGDKIDKP